MLPGWESVTEELDNNVAIFRIGNAGESREQRDEVITAESIEDDIRTLQNLVFSWILNRHCFIWKSRPQNQI
jgi:hypothetical protein